MISTSICRYQSLNLNHIREHSMPIYEFRWQRRALVLSQERDGPYCHVVRWDGNNKESIGAKMGAELPVVAVGQWMLRLSSGWTCREGERQELKGNRSVTGGHTSYSRTDVCLLFIFNILLVCFYLSFVQLNLLCALCRALEIKLSCQWRYWAWSEHEVQHVRIMVRKKLWHGFGSVRLNFFSHLKYNMYRYFNTLPLQ